METNKKVNKLSVALHYFLVYLPVLLIFGLILLIYITYLYTYIFVLIDGKKFDEDDFPLLHTSEPKNGKSKGIVFLSVTTGCLIMLSISLLRTVFMDPGYFPDPLELEYRVILKNTKKKK